LSASFISQYYWARTASNGLDPTQINQCAADQLINVSAMEWWMINREQSTENASVTLSWLNSSTNSTSQGSGGVGTNNVMGQYTGLRVARWNGTRWQNVGGGSHTGSNPTGTVTSTLNTSCGVGEVDNFSPFTLASNLLFNPLPVILVNFQAEVLNRQVKLNWQTSTELNTSHFVVERSRDGQNFEPLTQVAAKGNSTNLQLYNALDAQPFNGVSYYRLRIVDNDGSHEFSQVRRVTIGVAGGLGDVVVFPNPTDGRNINLRLSDPNAKVAVIHDLLGRQVAFRTAWNADGDLEVTFAETLAQGTYVAVVMSADGKQTSRIRFVVQR
ncbi:MAG: T9SS type A sorting domain-containing protein, partial [Cytophagales bacterium]|nr:T9SS type A sorting domain-containing protein [Cytophagales bacterium]